MPRTFVALDIAPAVCETVVELAESLRASAEGVKWVDRGNLHLTLNFLGDVADDRVQDVCRAVSQAAATRAAFEIELGGVGAFPNIRQARNIWIGVQGGVYQLAALQTALAEALAAIGFPKEHRPFTGHLTLGRLRHGIRPPRSLGDALKQLAEFKGGTSPVREVVVYESQLGTGSPVYTPLVRAPLSASL